MPTDIPWFRTSADTPSATPRSLVEAHIALLGAYAPSPLPCDIVERALPMSAFLAELATREALLAHAKAKAHAAYDAHPDEHGAMGVAAWDALVGYAAKTDDFVLLDVAQEVARQAAREVAAERASLKGMESGSSGGDAGGARVYLGRENGKYATRAVVKHALATMPGWAAVSKARDKATETTFMSVDSSAIDAAQSASLEAASEVARSIAARASLDDETLLTVSWDLAHEAARHISWHTTWTPTAAPENPWSPLLAIWRAGLGVFRLLNGAYLVYKCA